VRGERGHSSDPNREDVLLLRENRVSVGAIVCNKTELRNVVWISVKSPLSRIR
jgi:hypothetical protein